MSNMNQTSFSINYPAIYEWTKTSSITFFDSEPDLTSLFNPGSEQKESRQFFITDATVASLECMQDFISKFDDDSCGNDRLFILGSGEPYKTVESVQRIIQKAIEADFSRSDEFIGIGGGVICDLTAFAASIYKRGIKVKLVPTTLLAMVDAAIGGKTGCDIDNYKNMIGTFYPACNLYYYPDFVQSLPENQYNSGLAEAFKTAVIYDRELYDLFKESSEKLLQRDKTVLNTVIKKCVAAKGTIVEKDFTEQNIRAMLNLGHTFAHALETVMGLGAVTHGQAVAWGMGRAVALSYKKDYCNQNFYEDFLHILELYNWETQPVPSIVQGGGVGERLLAVMHKDKKNLDAKIRLVLPKGINDIVIEETEDADIRSVLK